MQAKHERAFVCTDQVLCVPELHRLQMVGATLAQCLHVRPWLFVGTVGKDCDRRINQRIDG